MSDIYMNKSFLFIILYFQILTEIQRGNTFSSIKQYKRLIIDFQAAIFFIVNKSFAVFLKLVDFQNSDKKTFFSIKNFQFFIVYKPSLGSYQVSKKVWPHRFSYFDVYWIQTNIYI